jgi:transposase-like protein
MEPTTLQEAVLYFADPTNCREYLVARRWPNGVTCPRCGDSRVVFQPKYNRWQCAVHHDLRQFTAKTGTVMEDSPIGLDKWLMTMWLIASCKNGISSYEIHRAIKVTQKTAWFMLHRCRLGMRDEQIGGKLSGDVEADETFIGGKVTNMYRRSKRGIQAKNDGNWGKTVVLGLLERNGRVRAAVAPTRSHYDVHSHVMANLEPGSTLFTDEYNAYQSLPPDTFTHEIINKLEGYVKGRIHVNGMENFWSLMKRTLKGTYISVDPVHLQAYVDEQVYRFNNRKPMNDAQRFSYLVRKIVGKRLTYAELTGKDQSSSETPLL